MHEYGTTQEGLGAVAVTHRKHASMNPNAQFRTPINMDDYMNSRWVAKPFHLLDCCPVSDGGASYIITTEERARDMKQTPVFIEGIGQSHPSWEFWRRPQDDAVWRQTLRRDGIQGGGDEAGGDGFLPNL